MSRLLPPAVACALLALPLSAQLETKFDEVFDGSPEHPAIHYQTGPYSDPVSSMIQRIDRGSISFSFNGPTGYLRSLLEALEVPVESQMVVFSKTSVQRQRITPSNPRFLYFNDSVVVGWVPGGFIEIASEDPTQGTLFYLLPQADGGFIARGNGCVTCHLAYGTTGVMGMLVRSTIPSADGMPIRPFGEYISDHRSPFAERWGGWYVTGKNGPKHLGNITADPSMPEPSPQPKLLASLGSLIHPDLLLSPYSDIVALTVFDHQMRGMNLITRVGWEARYAASEGEAVRAPMIKAAVNELVDYLLFIDEAPIPAKIEGSSGFTEKFSTQGPKDRKGRTLRELDLTRRLFRYPCSYLIYSEPFEALPPKIKDAIYSRFAQILSGQGGQPRYTKLSKADRQAIIEILRDTKPNLPSAFQTLVAN
jgi:hypothetical protein